MTQPVELRVPAIGDFDAVPVIEILVAVGDAVVVDQSVITLESDKATMEVPSSQAGVISELRVKLGDNVAEGDVIALLEPGDAKAESASEPPTDAAEATAAKDSAPAKKSPQDAEKAAGKSPATRETSEAEPAPETRAAEEASSAAGSESSAAVPPAEPSAGPASGAGGALPYASPAIRRFARELGVDLQRVSGSGRGGRIVREDVEAFVKQALAGSAAGGASAAANGLLANLPAWPRVDFAKFGEVERQPLSRINKLAGGFLARNWVSIPHVTQFDEADITELEAFRKDLGKESPDRKLTPLVFLIKAAVAALREFPRFNASLDGDDLVLKQYFHIGIAVDTPDGLVVPVLRDCDQKGLFELADELGEVSKKARDGKLAPGDMQGGCFSISSLGGIGGTAFTPIINAPEVAILGVSRSMMKPVWDGKAFQPQLMLPLSLSYDHRVIDGAAAARFTRHLALMLGDLRRLLL